jgi:hypothetical protein
MRELLAVAVLQVQLPTVVFFARCILHSVML